MTVLGKDIILERFDELFPGGDADRSNVRAAKYYLTLSRNFLILPSGKRYDRNKERCRSVVIEPGQTAYVTSAERVFMPPNLTGIIGPRFSSAEQGIFFFGGMLVDPGWGETDGRPVGEPLSFNIANLGRLPLEIRPGEDVIASLAFLEVGQARSRRRTRRSRSNTSEKNPTERAIQLREDLFSRKGRSPSALGLVEDLGNIRKEVDHLKASVNQVVLFGVVVLAATLFASLIAAVLGSSGESKGTKLSAESLWELGESFGWVVAAIALIVGLFYGLIKVANRVTAKRRGQRLRD